ncbi:MAG: hypothetical protein ABJL67_15435 [Sulfitobacter sp.]
MTCAIPAALPNGAALMNRFARTLMDVILHLGAHRTATTTFQRYLQDHRDDLAKRAVGFWDLKRVRKDIFPGLFRNSAAPKGRNVSQRAQGRIKLHAEYERQNGVKQLLISDENFLGRPIENLRSGRLYPGAGERTARISAAFSEEIRRIVISIRSQDLWWASTAALTVMRGHAVPSPARFEAISKDKRTWRDVITDLACAAPSAEIIVVPFENAPGYPNRLLGAALEGDVPTDKNRRWLNASAGVQTLRAEVIARGENPDLIPDSYGRWLPFNQEQAARLRENYADDLYWLTAGADGLATLTQDTRPKRADKSRPMGEMNKGQEHDKGQLAQYR